jgi:hypothetical protein
MKRNIKSSDVAPVKHRDMRARCSGATWLRMATAHQLSHGRRAGGEPAPDCSVGLHSVSRASISTQGDAITGRCTRCGCRLVKNTVTRSWYKSGMMG